MVGRKLLSMLLVLGLVLPAPLRAEEAPVRLVSIVINDTSGRGDEMARALESLASSYQLSIERILPAAASQSERVERGRMLLTEAKMLLKRMKFDAGLKKLNDARSSNDLTILRETYLHEAFVHSSMQRPMQAKEAMETYVLLGGAVPDDSFYAPEFIAVYKKARRKVIDRPRAELVVQPQTRAEARPSVYLDGFRIGEGSLRIPRTRIGLHHLKVEGDGLRSYEEVFQISESGKTIRPILEPLSSEELVAKIATLPAGDGRVPLFEKLQRESNAHGLLVVEGNSVTLFREQKRKWARSYREGERPSERDLQDIRDLYLPKPSVVVPVAVAPTPAPESPIAAFVPTSPAPAAQVAEVSSSSSHWYSKWWVWTLVGGAAAAGGAAFMLQGKSSNSASTVQLSVRPQ